MRENGPWKIKSSEAKYRSELIDVYEDEVIKPNGDAGTYSTVRVKAGVSVLPIDTEGFVYLARDFRYALGRESIEAVAGAIDEGESRETAARRELKEELGIEASEFVALGRVDPMPSLVDSPSYLFLAKGQLKFREKELEAGENVSTMKVKLSEAVRMVMRGDITHGSSCVLILRASDYLV
ncbi:MAG TPA: NUDIX hydrolase [Pyrinomonadaceae bacterium]|nr:NUDIX hydrolase [Pyrinomonadaceae bacterium]